MSLITCVVNVRNGERFIEETLLSLTSQKCPVEILVIDNCSTDSTAEIVSRFKNVRYARTSQPLQLGAARNAGLPMVITPYIAWVDADDLWHPLAAKHYEDAIRLYPDIHLFSSGCTLIDSHNHALPWWKQFLSSPGSLLKPKLLDEEDISKLLSSGQTAHAWCSYVFKLEAVTSVGGFDEQFEYVEDFDMICRVLAKGMGKHIQADITSYRVHLAQITNQIDPMRRYQERLAVINKFGIINSDIEGLFTFRGHLARAVRRINTLGELRNAARNISLPMLRLLPSHLLYAIKRNVLAPFKSILTQKKLKYAKSPSYIQG